MSKRVLITGGAGLVGSHAAEYYAKKGDEVIILDNLMRSKIFGYDKETVKHNWEYLSRYPIRRIIGDIRNKDDVEKAIQFGVDLVIHTAGQPGVPSSMVDPLEDLEINGKGTLVVLKNIRRECPKATFIYCSTNKVYGENVSTLPVRDTGTRYEYEDFWKRNMGIGEEMSIDHTGHTPYGVSKLTGDLYTQEYAHLYKMKTCVFRMSCTYGPRQFGLEEQGWVAWFIIAIMMSNLITIYGNGKQVRDLLYVDDLIEAFDKFYESKIADGVYNIGGGPDNTLSLLEFLKIAQEETGKIPYWYHADWRPSDQKVYVSNINKLKEELNWVPKTDYRTGIKRVVKWVQKNKAFFA